MPPGAGPLPDFGNQGVWLRVVLGSHGLLFLGALAANQQWAQLPDELLRLLALTELPLILTLSSLTLLRRLLLRLPGVIGWLLVLGISLTSTLINQLLLQPLGLSVAGERHLLWTLLCTLALLLYFALRARQHSPALAEARLAALTARIRPHFLFNSLNAVLGVIRSDPRRAESALEELADLFRVLMREQRELVPLSEEIALARQYLSLERLRLGERLQVLWEITDMPPDALLPPLLLQPLLENAVYHGIEPLPAQQEPGEIRIQFQRLGKDLQIEISNPCPAASAGKTHSGNRLALNNIRERLMLYFDLEAQLDIQLDSEHQRYRVRIRLPYRHEAQKSHATGQLPS